LRVLPWREAGRLKSSRRCSGFGPVGCQYRTLSLLRVGGTGGDDVVVPGGGFLGRELLAVRGPLRPHPRHFLLSDARVYEPRIRARLGTADRLLCSDPPLFHTACLALIHTHIAVRGPLRPHPRHLLLHQTSSAFIHTKKQKSRSLKYEPASEPLHRWDLGVVGGPLRPTLSVRRCRGWWLEQLLRRTVKRFRGGLVFKAHRRLYYSTLGLRVIKKKTISTQRTTQRFRESP